MTSMTSRKRNPSLIFPVMSATSPTTNGPRNEADLSVRANSEKNVDSWPCGQTGNLPLVGKKLTVGMSSA